MFFPLHYRAASRVYADFPLLNHDDTIEEDPLEVQRRITEATWAQHFIEPYGMHLLASFAKDLGCSGCSVHQSQSPWRRFSWMAMGGVIAVGSVLGFAMQPAIVKSFKSTCGG
mmetsp:Transcript_43426/g.94303  ORF Transcript_43426/g.94303 Transcript_43426/m.94303 type:complete len:113 (+) Transcript_43426:662-1000(+)